MSYFISTNGKVYSTKSNKNRNKPKFNTEQFGIINCFETKTEAWFKRDYIDDYHPRAFLCQEK